MNDNTNISDSLCRINLDATPYHKGFTMTFPNRITVSVAFGSGNYSDGKTNAECAAWRADDHRWVRIDGFEYYNDDVLPRMETHEIARFIYNASIHL